MELERREHKTPCMISTRHLPSWPILLIECRKTSRRGWLKSWASTDLQRLGNGAGSSCRVTRCCMPLKNLWIWITPSLFLTQPIWRIWLQKSTTTLPRNAKNKKEMLSRRRTLNRNSVSHRTPKLSLKKTLSQASAAPERLMVRKLVNRTR